MDTDKPDPRAASESSIYPLAFSSQNRSGGAEAYLRDPATLKLLEFFESKGLEALKDEDRREQWYEDWLAHQARHGLYAAVLSPRQFSTRGASFDLLRYSRFLEVFGYCSPAHGYSLQVTFLGLFAILMGSNEALKREAVARLEAGDLLAFGVSERSHGSDLMANEFRIAQASAGQWIANGSKYYIGNANVASIIAVLGRKEAGNDPRAQGRIERLPFMLVALRPKRATASWKERKIRTLGVRAAYVGEFEVVDHALSDGDVIAQGRQAWDAVFGTVTLGKFFLGFGSIGICEHAFHEAAGHLQQRKLYGKSVLDMSHIRSMMAQAYARLTAMKLYAYRTLDYVHAASTNDRRYQFFCAVQKAKVSTEGVKVVALLSECVGAKGFEGDTYCEMAMRDALLFPGLEGSMHINLALAAQFLPRYFQRGRAPLPQPPSLLAGQAASRENPYLMSARTGGANTIEFAWFLRAYRPFMAIANVALFIRQAATFRRFVQNHELQRSGKSDTQISLALGQCLATIAYGELVAQNATRLKVPAELVSVIFSLLVTDLNASAIQLGSIPSLGGPQRALIARMVKVPRTSAAEWNFTAGQFGS
jgi:acyl-CoA dehydrogenase